MVERVQMNPAADIMQPPAIEPVARERDKPSWGTLAALSVANAIGFMPSTCMPIWVGALGASLGWPRWTGGTVATVQLGALTLANLLAGRVLAERNARKAAPLAALLAALGFALMSIATPLTVIAGAVLSGAGCGGLLALVNAMAARYGKAQQIFALLQTILVVLGVVLFFTLPRLQHALGLTAVFLTLACCASAAAPLLRGALPSEKPSKSAIAASAARMNPRALAILLALSAALAAQAALMASIFEAGESVALDPPNVGTFMSGAAILCLAAPLAARALGDRLGLVRPAVVSTLALAVAAAWILHPPSAPVFLGLVACVMGLPLFIVPYILASLARFGGEGRWAAIGPGFMMAGAAAGPSIAGLLHARLTLAALGASMVIPLAAAAAVFGWASPPEGLAPSPDSIDARRTS
jgi:hypothetical protein